MKVYLAGRYSRRDELQKCAKELVDDGHEVTSRWLSEDHRVESAAEVEGAPLTVPMKQGRLFANDDYEDIENCDVFIAFTEPSRANLASRGGRHVEFGTALALDKWIIVIGPRENVFYCMIDEMFQLTAWNGGLVGIMISRMERQESGCRP